MSVKWQPMFDDLVRERYSRLVAFATLLAGSAQSEDLVQEALIATFSRRRDFPTVGHAEQYVRRAIANKYIDEQRKWKRDSRRAEATAPSDFLSDHSDAVAADSDLVRYLGSLPPRTRACIALRFLDDASVRDTAAALGLSEGAVKRYVSDGLSLLKAQLGDIAGVDVPHTVHVEDTRGSSS